MAHPVSLLSWVNYIDSDNTVLTASGQAGDLGIQNVADPVIGKRWRVTSMTAWGQADFGADRTVGVLALVFPRDTAFPLSGTIRHQLDPDGGSPANGAAYDSTPIVIGTADGYGYHVHALPASVSARFWRFTFDVSGVPFIDIGRAWAGDAFRPAYNIAFGYGDEWGDLSRISASARSGSEFVDERPRQRIFAFGLEALDESEVDDIRELQRIAGISRQILFVKNPEVPAKESIVGRLAQTTPIIHRELPILSKAFLIRESL